MNAHRPHCNGPMLPNFEGAACLPCGYVGYGNGRSYADTLALMAEDEVLLQASARKLGVGVKELRGMLRCYDPLRHEVAADLRGQGLSYNRIASVMRRHSRRIRYWFGGKA
jgi:hypothetical protein